MLDIKLDSEYEDLDKYKISEDYVYFKKNTNIIHNPYGAAIIGEDGFKGYWIENKLHRLDGPARIFPDGKEEYWINSKRLSKKQFEVDPERFKLLGKEHLICLL